MFILIINNFISNDESKGFNSNTITYGTIVVIYKIYYQSSIKDIKEMLMNN